MKRSPIASSNAAALALGAACTLLLLTGCGEGVSASDAGEGASHTTQAREVANLEPDLSLVTSRSAERWQRVVAADWIQAYDYQHPAIKAQVPLGTFLANKEHHEYRNPSRPRLIGSEGGQAFVELSVLWEPHHPILQTIKDRPDDMTEELHMVETWAWHEGSWYFVKNERSSEFHEAHKDLTLPEGSKG
jgi:hypothetical protein